MKKDKMLLNNLFPECSETDDIVTKRLIRNKRNQAFSEYEKIVMQFLELGVESADILQIEACQYKIDQEYQKLIDVSNVRFAIEKKMENKRKLDLEDIIEYIKEETKRIIFLSKIKELQHLYEIKRYNVKEEERIVARLEENVGLEKILDAVESNQNIKLKELETEFLKENSINVRKILHKGRDYFYFTGDDKNQTISLSSEGWKAQLVRQKREEKKYSQVELEEGIYKGNTYLLQSFVENRIPDSFVGISQKHQKILKKKSVIAYKCVKEQIGEMIDESRYIDNIVFSKSEVENKKDFNSKSEGFLEKNLR